MDNLFEEDEIQPSPEEPADLPPTDSRDAVYRLHYHLRRCGATKRLAGDIADKLLERLSSNPIRLLRLDDEFHVDELLWYFTVIKLQQDAETASILYELDAWEYYRQQASILATGDNRLQEIHIYSSITDVPCIVYCQNKKRFSREFTHSGVPFVSDIRYHLVLEKVKSAHIDVVAVDAASRVSKEEQLLIGTLGLDKKGDICLQGALSEIRMLITEETVIRSGIYCDSNTVIVRCVMEPYKESVRCLEIGHPPACVFMDLPDFFGGKLTNQETKALEDRMKLRGTVDSEQWIVISDIHLDNDAVLESFESLLKTFISIYQYQGFPTGFILMGNFTSVEFHTAVHGKEKYSQAFERLYRVLVQPKYRILLMSCYFVLVPGTGDATLCNQLMPTQPLLKEFSANIRDRMATYLGDDTKFITMTNPCRIRHLTRRMVFCRSDVLNKLLSTSILTSGTDYKIATPAELKEMLINTLLGQGHLCPNKPGVHSVLKHDAALLLYPHPDLVCIADLSCPSFISSVDSTTICNVESFSKNRSFISYDVISGKAQKLAL